MYVSQTFSEICKELDKREDEYVKSGKITFTTEDVLDSYLQRQN